MEKSRVQAYLQSACSVLNFDIGEIWVCRDVANSGTHARTHARVSTGEKFGIGERSRTQSPPA